MTRASLLVALLLVATVACRDGARSIRPRELPAVDQVAPLVRPGPLSDRIASYRIDATLDAAEKRITAKSTLTWRNTSSAPVAALPFHLYMNAFKNEESLFFRESRGQFRRAKAERGKWGWIEVASIQVGGAELRPGASYGADETVLTVPLATPVAPGATVEVAFTFVTQLPQVFARTGYRGEFIMVAQWFPKIGVLGEKGWHCEPFHAASEFFADFGTYDVTLTVPETHAVAATGVLTGARKDGQTHVLTYRAEDVHDFAWAADPFMTDVRGTAAVDGAQVEVVVWARPEQAAFARRHLAAGIVSIEAFSKHFYPYPWARMTIIDPPMEAASGAGGMEYPTLVTTAGDYAFTGPGVYIPEQVTVHEVGHNWFQGILASNEVDEAWLDEGVNEYADGVVMDDWLGADRSFIDWHGYRLSYYGLHGLVETDDVTSPIASKSYEFPSFDDYGAATYMKTAQALKTLEGMMGRETFLAALGAYARKFAFKHPTLEDFFAAFPDHRWFLEPAFLSAGTVDLRLSDVRNRPVRPPRGVFGEGDGRRTEDPEKTPEPEEWIGEATVVNLGRIPVAVEVELRFSDGARVRERWDGRGGWKRFETRRKARLVGVTVDPEGAVLLQSRRLDDGWREERRTGPSWRAAARAGFWEQTLLQMVGP